MLATADLPETPLGPLAISADGRHSWVALGGDSAGDVLEFAEGTARRLGEATVGWAPASLAESEGILWVSNTEGDGSHPSGPGQDSVTELTGDPTSVLATTGVSQPELLAANSKAAFVVSGQTDLYAIAPGSPKRELLTFGALGRPIALAADQDGVWVSTAKPGSEGLVIKVDEESGKIILRVATDGVIASLTESNSKVYAILQPPSGPPRFGAVDRSGFVYLADLPPNLAAASLRSSSTFAWVAGNDQLIDRIRLSNGESAIFPLPADGPTIAIAPATDAHVWALASTGLIELGF